MGLRNKRLTTAVMSAFVSSAVLVSLATPAQAAETLNIISLYKTSGGVEKDAMKLLISKFEAASGATVKLTEAADVATQYNSDLLAGKAADIMIVNLFDKTNAWLELGASVPVGDYIKQWGLSSKISAGGIADWTDKTGSGAVQGFPFAGFSWPVWYNTDLLAKAGIKKVPQTTDQLIAAAKALKAKGIAPIVTGGSDWSGNKMWSQIVQSYMSPTEAKKVFSTGGFCASKNAMKGINLFVKMRNGGVFVKGVEGYTADQMNTAYYTGKAAIMAAGSWAMPSTPAAIAAVTEMGGIPMPAGAYYKKPTAFQAYSAVGVFVSPNGVAKLPLIKQFITQLYSADVIAKFVSDVAIIPATKTPLTPASLASASTLLAQSVTKLPSKVDYALFPDNYVGARGSALEKASALAYGAGTKPAAICKAADNAYKG